MHLKIGKKINFFFYISLLVLLSSINNFNFKIDNFFNIKYIEVNGLTEIKNKKILNELENIIGKNIVFINRKYFVGLNNRNDTKNLEIKKIYPNKIKINLTPAKPFCIIKTQSGEFILGDNGKKLDIKKSNIDLPISVGSNNINNIFNILNLFKSSNFDYYEIKNIIFFKSGRFDIIMKNELLIKFPLETNQKQINYAKKLLNDKKFVNSKIIDLRIKNRIIKYE